jgi:hypothetical protein
MREQVSVITSISANLCLACTILLGVANFIWVYVASNDWNQGILHWFKDSIQGKFLAFMLSL